jgi:hypothetical protein
MRSHTPEPIWLPLHPSRYLAGYLLLAPLALRAVGAAAVIAGLLGHWRRHVQLRGRGAVRHVHWRSDGSWWLSDGEGQQRVYRHAQVRLLQPWLVLLRLKGGEGRCWLVLAGDSADPDGLRRLRVRLRREQPAADQADPACGT